VIGFTVICDAANACQDGATPVRLSAIAVANHSRIPDLALEVRQHAVIVGANDVGKSSILRLLHMTLGASTGALYQRLSKSDLAKADAPLVVDVTLSDFTDVERALFTSEIHIADDGATESLHVRLSVEQDPQDEETVAIRRWFPEAGHERAPSSKQMQGFGWRYLPATRGVTAANLDGRDSALRTLLGATDLGDQRATLVDLIEKFNTELGSSANVVDLLERVATHLSRAMPKSVATGDIAIRSTADPETDVLGNVSMFVKKDGAHIPLSDQSDGVRQLTAMTLFDLAEGTANVVAIDEPELHLHPSSQRTIAELFASSGNQKVLATHSAYIVHRFEPSHIIAVGPDGECHQIAEDKLSLVEKQRVNWWSPRLLEALTARSAIVVEGPSDRAIVEATARAMGIELDRLGAVVFDIDGADKFSHVYKLIGKDGFGIHILGLVDEKEQGPWFGAFGGKPKDVRGTSLWVSAPDLEAEYAEAFTGPGLAQALIDGGYCKESAILQSAGATTLADVTEEAAAAFCRKGKTEAATVVASQLDVTTAAKITSVAGLLNALSGRDIL
jgi:putative ATP-dependent endonuclease of OLD family